MSTKRHWTGISKSEMKKFLLDWGSTYKEVDLGDGRGNALVLAGSSIKLNGYNLDDDPVVTRAKKKAFARSKEHPWPQFYFRDDSAGNAALGRPRIGAMALVFSMGMKLPPDQLSLCRGIDETLWRDSTLPKRPGIEQQRHRSLEQAKIRTEIWKTRPEVRAKTATGEKQPECSPQSCSRCRPVREVAA